MERPSAEPERLALLAWGNRRASVALHFAAYSEMVRLMTLRTLPPAMAARAIAQIDARLAAISQQHGVAIPFAIESGSRAWGFPSPNSDYDCRFVFVRQLDDYLSPWQRRDVIETPVEGDLDVNGWDLAKAVRLLAGGNAVIIEWLMSPVLYQAEEQFRGEFLALARRIADRHLVARHYLHLGERFWDACLAADGAAPRKKILYALRPAVALRWLRLHGEAVAPMYMPALLAECDPPAGLARRSRASSRAKPKPPKTIASRCPARWRRSSAMNWQPRARRSKSARRP